MSDSFCTRITLASVGSTSTYLKEHPELWRHRFLAVRAVEQTAGRGRQLRTWHTGAGLDLALSLLWRPENAVPGMPCLTLGAGLAVFRALSSCCADLSIKWPNDIHHRSGKLAGILCEQELTPEGPVIIIGVGVNVNGTSFPAELTEAAVSLKNITGIEHDLDDLADVIVAALVSLLPRVRDPLSVELHGEWLRASNSLGSRVQYEIQGVAHEGVITAVNRDGSLVLEGSCGETRHAYGGDARVLTDSAQ